MKRVHDGDAEGWELKPPSKEAMDAAREICRLTDLSFKYERIIAASIEVFGAARFATGRIAGFKAGLSEMCHACTTGDCRHRYQGECDYYMESLLPPETEEEKS